MLFLASHPQVIKSYSADVITFPIAGFILNFLAIIVTQTQADQNLSCLIFKGL